MGQMHHQKLQQESDQLDDYWERYKPIDIGALRRQNPELWRRWRDVKTQAFRYGVKGRIGHAPPLYRSDEFLHLAWKTGYSEGRAAYVAVHGGQPRVVRPDSLTYEQLQNMNRSLQIVHSPEAARQWWDEARLDQRSFPTTPDGFRAAATGFILARMDGFLQRYADMKQALTTDIFYLAEIVSGYEVWDDHFRPEEDVEQQYQSVLALMREVDQDIDGAIMQHIMGLYIHNKNHDERHWRQIVNRLQLRKKADSE